MRRVLFPVWLTVLGLGFALLPLARGRLFFYFDNARQHYAQTAFLHNALRSGLFPQWYPAVGLGFPAVAEGQAAHHFPPRVLLAYLFSPSAALMWEVGLYLAIAGVATYLFLRECRLIRWAAAVGGLTQMFSAASLIYVRNMALHRSLCLVPLAMFFTERWFRTGSVAPAAGFSIVLALQLLSGHPTMAIVTLAGASTYWLSRHLQRAQHQQLPLMAVIQRVAIALGAWGGAVIAGFALAAIQVVPTALLAAESTRQGGLTFDYSAGNLASRLGDLFQVVLPYAYRQGDWTNPGSTAPPELNFNPFSNMYVGALPLLLAWCALVYSRRWPRPTLPLVVTSVTTIVLALGNKTPLYFMLWSLPGMSGMRYPSRFLLLSSFCLACVGAIGFQRIAIMARTNRSIRSLPLVVAAAGAAVLVIGVAFAAREPAARSGIAVSIAIWVAASAIVVAVVRQRFSRGVALAALTALVAADLLVFRSVSGYAATYPATEATVVSEPAAAIKRDRSRFRTLSLIPLENGLIRNDNLRDLVQANLSSTWGIDSMDTRGSLLPLRYFLLREGLVWELTHNPDSARRLGGALGALNVKYVVGDASVHLEGWDQVFASKATRVWQNPEALPRMYVVGRVQPEGLHVLPERRERAIERLSSYHEIVVDWSSREADAQIVDSILSSPVDYRTTAIVDADTGPALSGAQPKYQIEDLTSQNPNDVIHMRVRTDGAGLLVTGNSFAPGWSATVNGKAVTIVRANWLLQGIFVGAGESDVLLTYQAPGFKLGASVTAAAGLLLCGVVLVGRGMKRRSGPP